MSRGARDATAPASLRGAGGDPFVAPPTGDGQRSKMMVWPPSPERSKQAIAGESTLPRRGRRGQVEAPDDAPSDPRPGDPPVQEGEVPLAREVERHDDTEPGGRDGAIEPTIAREELEEVRVGRCCDGLAPGWAVGHRWGGRRAQSSGAAPMSLARHLGATRAPRLSEYAARQTAFAFKRVAKVQHIN